jgi:hypothetical protein
MTQVGSILLSWPQDAAALAYAIRYRRSSPGYTNWTDVRVQAPSFRLDSQESGTYEFQISSIGLFGATSSPTSFSYTLNVEAAQSTAAYAGLGEITLSPISHDLGLLEWSAPAFDSTVLLRHQSDGSEPEWGSSTSVLPPIPADHGHAYVPLLDGAYIAKLSGGVLTTSVRCTRPVPLNRTLLTDIEEAPAFAGTKIGVEVNAATGALRLTASALIDDLGKGEDIDSFGAIDTTGLVDTYTSWDDTNVVDAMPLIDSIGPAWDGLTSIDGAGGTSTSGEYLFNTAYDATSVTDVYVRRRLQLATTAISALFDDRTSEIDTWTDVDELAPGDGDVGVFVQTSTDNTAWSDWRPVVNSLHRGRYFRFKAVLSTADPSQNVNVVSLGATLDTETP